MKIRRAMNIRTNLLTFRVLESFDDVIEGFVGSCYDDLL